MRIVMVALATCIAADPACAVQRYVATSLGTLGGTIVGDHVQGNAINDSGEVAGSASRFDFKTRAFLHDGSSMRELGLLDGNTFGNAINALGQVTGTWASDVGTVRTFLYADGVMTGLDIFPGRETQAYAINAAGQIAGAVLAHPGPYHPFIYSGGRAVDLGTLGGPDGRAYGLNSFGDVVGAADVELPGQTAKHAFLVTRGKMKDLGTLGGPWSFAYAVNDIGWVTGESATADDYERAFLYSGGNMVDLGDFGGRRSAGFAIDGKGQVVGRAAVTTLTPDENPWRAFLFTGGTMHDINGLVDSGLDGAVLREANGINERGQIVANGCKAGTCRAYRLDPLADPLPSPIPGVPTLSEYALLATAALVLAGAFLRRPRPRTPSGSSTLKWALGCRSLM